MEEKIDSELVKKWIQHNQSSFESQEKLNERNQPLFDYEIIKILKKLQDNSDLRFIPLRDISTGKKIVRKFRKLLQNEVHDWTLSIYLDSQSYFNHLLVELLENVIKQPNSSQSKIEKDSYSFFITEFINSEIVHAFYNVLNREPDKKASEYYFKEILKQKITIKKLYEILRQTNEYDKLVDSRERKEIIIQAKKIADFTKYSSEYEKQKLSNIKNALYYVDIPKIAYYNNLPMSERFNEYFWVLKNLKTSGALLDIGCTESIFAQELSKIQSMTVYGIDIREPEYTPKFNFSLQDCTDTNFDDSFFDQITVISSIEHFGLNIYGNEKLDKMADIHTMIELKRILKNDGIVFLTLPFGKGDKSWYRKYDEELLNKLLDGFTILENKIIRQTLIGWVETDPKNALSEGDSIYYDGLPGAIGLVKARKK